MCYRGRGEACDERGLRCSADVVVMLASSEQVRKVVMVRAEKDEMKQSGLVRNR